MTSAASLPYLTASLPGIGGRIKTRPEDFVVEELPLYEACGEGTHVYFRVRKTGLTTMQAIHQIARALGRPNRDFGYAGLKDAGAVTTQMLSIEHIDPAKVQALALPRIEIVSVSRHGNKLKLGHLGGNRFTIRIREVERSQVEAAKAIMDVLVRRGVPNYFGPQRFGSRGDTWEIGRAVLKGDVEEAIHLMLGRPGPADYGAVRAARELFEQGNYEQAAQAWPHPFHAERRICREIASRNGNLRRGYKLVDPQMRRFFLSAYQSYFFNQVVAQRIDHLDRLLLGDLAWRHANGAVFRVEDVQQEQPRCDAFEISPSGPLFGYRMTEPDGQPGEVERTLLASEGMSPETWRDGTHKVRGARRPLRFQPRDAAITSGQDDAGDFLQVCFALEPGCYATTGLREICKNEAAREKADDGD